MSIDHILKFNSSETPEEVFKLLQAVVIDIKESGKNTFTTKGGWGIIFPMDKDSQYLISEQHNLSTNISLTFVEDSNKGYGTDYEVLGNVIAFTLAKEEGDAILFWVIDTPILKRLKGKKIQVTDDKHFDWLRNALSEFNLVFDLVPKGSIER